MFRPASLMNVTLVAILAAAPLANAGGPKHFKPPAISVPDFKLPGTLQQAANCDSPNHTSQAPNCLSTYPTNCLPSTSSCNLPPKPPVICPPPVIKPICYKPVCPPVCTCNNWYFGMSLQLTDSHYGRGLQVTSVTPGSPAHQAGLEPGDVLYAVDQTTLQTAVSNEHGVQLLQSEVDPVSGVYGHALLSSVLDASTNQVIQLQVYPTRTVEETPVPTTLAALTL